MDINQKTPAHVLCEKLFDAYSLFECKKALYLENGDLPKAAQFLMSGAWRGGKLISWNHESLQAKAKAMSATFGKPESFCLETLKDCGGNEELACLALQGKTPSF